MSRLVRVEALVQRHHPEMPRYVVVPTAVVAGWQLDGTTVVEGTLNGTSLGRRSLKRWGEDRWFLDLPERWCRQAGIATGDRVKLALRVASTSLPEELEKVLSESPKARAAWKQMTASQKRMLREHVLAAKRPATRVRRARRYLGLTC